MCTWWTQVPVQPMFKAPLALPWVRKNCLFTYLPADPELAKTRWNFPPRLSQLLGTSFRRSECVWVEEAFSGVRAWTVVLDLSERANILIPWSWTSPGPHGSGPHHNKVVMEKWEKEGECSKVLLNNFIKSTILYLNVLLAWYYKK